MSRSKIIGIGKISAVNCKYEWKIHDFLSYNGKNATYQSPNFSTSNSSWFIKINPNGHDDEGSTGYVSIFLCRKFIQESENVNFSFGIKTVSKMIENELKTSFKDPNFGWAKFMEKSQLQQRRSFLVPSGTLTIVCLIESQDTALGLLTGCRKLAGDFKNVFIAERNTDVKLKVKGRTLTAHKIVLEARSPVFAAMFKNDMTEKKTGEINIRDCDPDAFDAFLLFLYSGEQDISKCNVQHLYKITDKYDVPELKLMCVDFMIKNLSTENFAETLILADKFDDGKLLIQVQNFFNDNFGEIFSSDGWELLLQHNYRLANFLLKAMAPKVSLNSK